MATPNTIDPRFTSQKASEPLLTVISDTDKWLVSFPRLPHVARNEKGNKLVVKVEELVSIHPFKMSARRVFGELVDGKLADELFRLNIVHERAIEKFERWKIFKYLPVQANRDIDGFGRDWAALLERCSLETERSSGITTTVEELYKNMKGEKMTFLEFAHSIGEILVRIVACTILRFVLCTCLYACGSYLRSPPFFFLRSRLGRAAALPL